MKMYQWCRSLATNIISCGITDVFTLCTGTFTLSKDFKLKENDL